MTSEFILDGPNTIKSEDGEIRIHRVGLSNVFRDRAYEIDSEMLAPPMSIAVYFSTSDAAKASDGRDIFSFIKNRLAFRGFAVEFI